MVTRILVNFSVVWLFLISLVSAAETIRINQINTDSPDGVSVTVQTASENIPQALDIHLLLDGQKAAAAAEIERSKLALVICVDVSGSIAGEPLEEIKSALRTLLSSNALNSDDRIALVSIEQKARRLQWFADQQKNLEKLAALEWLKGRKTVIYDALYEVLEDLEKQNLGDLDKRRVLLLSDGKDEGSNKTRQDVLTKAAAAGIPIDVVTRVRKDRVKEDQAEGYTQDLFSLSDATGGSYRAADPGGVADALAWIFQQQPNVYRIHFKYEKDSSAPKASAAEILFQLPENKSFQVKIPGEIPPRKVEKVVAKESSGMSWLIWVLSAAVGIVLAGLVYYQVERKKTDQPQVEPDDSSAPETPVPPRKTMVVGYNFLAPGPGKPTVLLIGIEGSVKAKIFPMEQELFYIGADSRNDLCLTEDDYVSGNHAYLSYTEGNLLLFDRDSLNGTFVNGQPVDTSGCALQLGDRIKFGKTTLEVGRVPD